MVIELLGALHEHSSNDRNSRGLHDHRNPRSPCLSTAHVGVTPEQFRVIAEGQVESSS